VVQSDRKAAFVDKAMVVAAKQDQVVERGFSTASPVVNVMRVDEPVPLTARELTAAVPRR
jgi:hypothetical protein